MTRVPIGTAFVAVSTAVLWIVLCATSTRAQATSEFMPLPQRITTEFGTRGRDPHPLRVRDPLGWVPIDTMETVFSAIAQEVGTSLAELHESVARRRIERKARCSSRPGKPDRVWTLNRLKLGRTPQSQADRVRRASAVAWRVPSGLILTERC